MYKRQIFCNQVEQLTLEEWEKAGGRANGRAGNWRDLETGARLYQIIGDANPDHDFHWILNDLVQVEQFCFI